jgi:hypothetical protein
MRELSQQHRKLLVRDLQIKLDAMTIALPVILLLPDAKVMCPIRIGPRMGL